MKGVVLLTVCLAACVYGHHVEQSMNDDEMAGSMGLMEFDEDCVTMMNDMINYQVESVFQYIAMATFFRRHDVDIVGMSLMYNSWSRMKINMAKMMIMYLVKRGVNIEFKDVMKPEETMWTSPADALKTTMMREKHMMGMINDLAKHATEHSDAHLMAFIEQNMVGAQADYMFETASYMTKLQKGGLKFGLSAMNMQMVKKYRDFKDCESDAEKYKWNY